MQSSVRHRHAPAAVLPSSAGGVPTAGAAGGGLHAACRLAASMCSMRAALDAMTALRMALSMLGLYPPATSVPSPTCTVQMPSDEEFISTVSWQETTDWVGRVCGPLCGKQ